MKLKKVLAAAMISLLATTALVGCGSDKKVLTPAKRCRLNTGTLLLRALAAQP